MMSRANKLTISLFATVLIVALAFAIQITHADSHLVQRLSTITKLTYKKGRRLALPFTATALGIPRYT